MKPRRATGALVNVAVLERELGNVEYHAWKIDQALAAGDLPADHASPLHAERAALHHRRASLLERLDAENTRLADLRTEHEGAP